MSNINYDGLKNNLIYVLKESQIKIGYTPNSVGFNYPLDSLNRLLNTNADFEEMKYVLEGFCSHVRGELGDIKISVHEGKYCLTVPKEGTAYVNENIKDSGFLTDLIAFLRECRGSADIQDILKIFRKYSQDVKCFKAYDDEFNYIAYFNDGYPDEFIYCIDIDLGHVTYHRLTKGDFEALGFNNYLKEDFLVK